MPTLKGVVGIKYRIKKKLCKVFPAKLINVFPFFKHTLLLYSISPFDCRFKKKNLATHFVMALALCTEMLSCWIRFWLIIFSKWKLQCLVYNTSYTTDFFHIGMKYRFPQAFGNILYVWLLSLKYSINVHKCPGHGIHYYLHKDRIITFWYTSK